MRGVGTWALPDWEIGNQKGGTVVGDLVDWHLVHSPRISCLRKHKIDMIR
jgi:hypothetical protein